MMYFGMNKDLKVTNCQLSSKIYILLPHVFVTKYKEIGENKKENPIKGSCLKSTVSNSDTDKDKYKE